jgi:hypothetical protein
MAEHIKDPEMVKRGKRNKKVGAKLEAEARAALVDAGYILCRWQNTVIDGKLQAAKPKWNFFTKSMSYTSTGFPDFIVMKPFDELGVYKIIGCESKRNGYLDPEERVMVKWYLDNKIFPKIVIAKKDKSGHLVFMDSQSKEELLVGDIFK